MPGCFKWQREHYSVITIFLSERILTPTKVFYDVFIKLISASSDSKGDEEMLTGRIIEKQCAIMYHLKYMLGHAENQRKSK